MGKLALPLLPRWNNWRTRRQLALDCEFNHSRDVVCENTTWKPEVWRGIIKNENTFQLWGRRFCRNSSLQAVCDTPIARITGCFSPSAGGLRKKKKNYGLCVLIIKDIGRRLPLFFLIRRRIQKQTKTHVFVVRLLSFRSRDLAGGTGVLYTLSVSLEGQIRVGSELQN